MKVTIDCEVCGGEGGIWKGGTIPVACPAECDNGQVELYGDEATDELERREVAARRAVERKAVAEVALVAARGFAGSLARSARRDGQIVARPIGCAPGWTAYVRGHEERYASSWGANEAAAVAELIESIECIDDGGETDSEVAAGIAVARERYGLVEAAPVPARTAWPFDVALEASRDHRARRTNAHPATVAAFAHFAANPAAGFEERAGLGAG